MRAILLVALAAEAAGFIVPPPSHGLYSHPSPFASSRCSPWSLGLRTLCSKHHNRLGLGSPHGGLSNHGHMPPIRSPFLPQLSVVLIFQLLLQAYALANITYCPHHPTPHLSPAHHCHTTFALPPLQEAQTSFGQHQQQRPRPGGAAPFFQMSG
jgi:hypothetical protein